MNNTSKAIIFLAIAILGQSVVGIRETLEINYMQKQISCLSQNMIYVGDNFCAVPYLK